MKGVEKAKSWYKQKKHTFCALSFITVAMFQSQYLKITTVSGIHFYILSIDNKEQYYSMHLLTMLNLQLNVTQLPKDRWVFFKALTPLFLKQKTWVSITCGYRLVPNCFLQRITKSWSFGGDIGQALVTTVQFFFYSIIFYYQLSKTWKECWEE